MLQYEVAVQKIDAAALDYRQVITNIMPEFYIAELSVHSTRLCKHRLRDVDSHYAFKMGRERPA